MKSKSILGRLLFGSLFMIVLPALLVLWAHFSKDFIRLPVPSHPVAGLLMIVTGSLFVISGMANLWRHGKGLPMNAYPPEFFVTKGVYTITKNPVYFGSIILCFGCSSLWQSAAGFWLVSPMFTLMVVAYTVGFENERNERISGYHRYHAFLSLPASSETRPAAKERMGAFIISFAIWFLVYEAFIYLGVPGDAIYTNLPVDDKIPLMASTVLFYVMAYPLAMLVPFVVTTGKQLRNFVLDVWLATAISGFIYFMLPFAVEQKAISTSGTWEKLLLFDRSLDGSSAALPAFHVIWACLSTRYFTKAFPKLQVTWILLAVLISLSCLTTGNHTVMDVVGGAVVFLMVTTRKKWWNLIRHCSELIANSWNEWQFGQARLINHGIYAGAAAFAGTFILGCILGSSYAYTGFVAGVLVIVGAALWAQYIEGSPRLLRPYGYYGSVIGAVIASFIMMLAGVNFFVLMAGIAMAAPWVQVIGRLRCLVQGCCHGKATHAWLGIRFTHPYSRVNKISGLGGICIHPTQLYSIGANLVIGMILIRLYILDMPSSFITGIYLILNALARFVEEFYRGELQTPYWHGMRIYQWIAILNMVAGAVFTCIPSMGMPLFTENIPSLYWSTAISIFATAAYGLDFPDSTKRFARLTSN